ncbi:septation protein SepH [Naumannella halotolerans]|uniref:DUF3071 domain-containing protein n=1 Tax=Naumannella halotolerans TaxID=993414 RepID=A0A4V3END3_9ACTN|nr:septation protein SepH [Naumannella halotolerans]TDT33228.1 Protein of unknown function (DUF3071) [Naumannella halotolerans]
MDIGLTPREIQTRVRAGASLAEVAEAAGVPSERIEPFAAPVLAEREHIASLALAAAVRRRGEAAAHRTLNVAVTDRLGRRGIADDQVTWDAWRREDRRWTLVARYELGALPREAVFYYNQQSRISEPANDDARWLAGELSALPGAPDDPTEPTIDLDDELALVRALREPLDSDPGEVPGSDPEPPLRLYQGWQAETDDEVIEPDPNTTPEAAPHVPLPRSQATPQDIGQEIEAQLSSYGGNQTAGLDLLYDLFDGSGTDREYAGLTEPEQPPLDFGEEAEPEQPAAGATGTRRRRKSKGRAEARSKKSDSSESTPVDSSEAATGEFPRATPGDSSESTPGGSSQATGSVPAEAGSPGGSSVATPTAGAQDVPPGADEPTVPVPTDAEPSTIPPVAEEPGADRSTPRKGPADPVTASTGVDGDEHSGRPNRETSGSPSAPKASTDRPAAAASGSSDRSVDPDVSTDDRAKGSEQGEAEEQTVQIPRPRKRRKRASVPTWDEIMFGGDSDD